MKDTTHLTSKQQANSRALRNGGIIIFLVLLVAILLWRAIGINY